VLLSLLFITNTIVYSQTASKSPISSIKLVGCWQLLEDGEPKWLEFSDDMNGRVKSINEDIVFTYSIASSGEQNYLEIKLEEESILYSILLINDNTIELCSLPSDEAEISHKLFLMRVLELPAVLAPISTFYGLYKAEQDSIYSAIEILPCDIAKIHTQFLRYPYTTSYVRHGAFIFIKYDTGNLAYELIDGNTIKGPGGGLMDFIEMQPILYIKK